MEKQFDHEYITEVDEHTKIVRACAWSPPGCHPTSCGVELTIKDGKLIHVEGDESQPITKGRLCPRCLTLKDYTYHKDRIIYPMKRDPQYRGQADKWERTAWDEAYDTIERNVRKIKETYGAETMAVFMGTGREASMYAYNMAYSVLGCPNVVYPLSGVSCYGPRQVTGAFVLGAGYPEIDYAAYYPERFDHPEFELPKYIICWGKAPLQSNGDGLFGHAIIDMMKMGSRVICIDPRITWLGAQPGNITVQLRPGTDCALALAFINIIISEGLYDHDFVEKWCFGFEELAERASHYPAADAAEITCVPEDTIVTVARLISINHPVSIAWGLAVDQNPNGLNVGQAILSIQAITGNIDVPGGLALGTSTATMGDWSGNSMRYLDPAIAEKKLGSSMKYPLFQGPNATCQSDEVLDALESGVPYKLHMAWYNSSNFLSPTCSAQPERWRKALVDLDFAIAQDTFMTPTIQALADYFLPLPTYAEHDGLVVPYYGANNVWTACTVEALRVGDTRSDPEICYELGKRLCPEAWEQYASVEEFFDDQCMRSYGFKFADLKEMGTYFPGNVYKKYEKGMMRPDGKPGFNTVTGRAELYVGAYASFGLDPLPDFHEPPVSPVSHPEYVEKYPFIISSGARTTLSFHSEHRQIERLRSYNPYPLLEINPADAERLGIKEGDWVEAFNMNGTAKARAHVVPTIRVGVLHMQHGWWYPEQDGNYPNLYGVYKSNFNMLMPHHCIGPAGFGAPYKSIMCGIRLADEPATESSQEV